MASKRSPSFLLSFLLLLIWLIFFSSLRLTLSRLNETDKPVKSKRAEFINFLYFAPLVR